MFKVIVAGGRDFNNYELLCTQLDYLLSDKVAEGEEIIIVSGTANGGDKLGERYAKDKGYKIYRFPADWNKYGKGAGYRRNAVMASVANACVCFMHKDGSPGTKNMIETAEKRGLQLRVIYFE